MVIIYGKSGCKSNIFFKLCPICLLNAVVEVGDLLYGSKFSLFPSLDVGIMQLYLNVCVCACVHC